MAPMSPILAAFILAAPQVESPATRVYEKVAPSIVGVRARAPLGERSGTGIVLDREGHILTSSAICPQGSVDIRVWTRGPRRLDAELVAISKRDEIALLRVKPAEALVPLEWGGSSAVRVGDVSYTIGNAANSIILDDQPSFNVGVVSGLYRLDEERANSSYVGPILETTAAVNVGMEGAPCLDARGRFVGMVTLNYSPHRFLGAAIPADGLKPVIDRLLKERAVETPEEGEGWLGLTARDEGGRVVVEAVDKGGPADRAGIRKGDVIVEAGAAPVRSARALSEWLRKTEAGAVAWLTVDIGGQPEKVKVVLEKKR